ncbi:MAG: hypothetical protein Kow0063_15430 [Anaerolineae bacterium]
MPVILKSSQVQQNFGQAIDRALDDNLCPAPLVLPAEPPTQDDIGTITGHLVRSALALLSIARPGIAGLDITSRAGYIGLRTRE